jgi:formylglycine-generating enzyme required for sulfatase activity
MVRVAGQRANYALVMQLGYLRPAPVEAFLIDKYEVTNRQFKEFVDAGGYRRIEFWKEPFLKDGQAISWERAMDLFRDSTGRTGPATWEAGRYPDGQENYPVGGVSWYEAAAYAAFAGKSLPTVRHWYMAADPPSSPFVAPLSNFGNIGPAPVGKFMGLGTNGTYDMAGNVKEWCWNASTDGKHFLLGGGWSEPMYQYQAADARDSLDRATMNGFRCVTYTNPPSSEMVGPIARFFRDFTKEKPCSDEQFELFRSFYEYEKLPLNPKVEFVKDN